MLEDVLGKKVAREIGEEVGSVMETLRLIGWKDIRPWNEFLPSFTILKAPQWNWKHLEQRVVTNFLHFRSNYLVISLFIFFIQLIFAPLVCLALLILICFNIYLLLLHKQPISFGETKINEKQKIAFCIIISAVILILTGALTVLSLTILYCITVCGLHMMLRPRSVTSKANKIYEEIKLSGYSSWFGGSDSSTAESDPENPSISNSVDDYGNSNINGQYHDGSMRKRSNVNTPGSFSNISSTTIPSISKVNSNNMQSRKAE